MNTNDDSIADQNNVRFLDGIIKPKILNCGRFDATILKSGINTVRTYKVIRFSIKLKKMNTIPEKGSEISLNIGTMNMFNKDRAIRTKANDFNSFEPKLNPLTTFLLKIRAM